MLINCLANLKSSAQTVAKEGLFYRAKRCLVTGSAKIHNRNEYTQIHTKTGLFSTSGIAFLNISLALNHIFCNN